jgi:hypothetical protein
MAYNYWCENRKNNPDCTFCNSKGDIQSDDKFKGATCFNNDKVKLKLMGETTHQGINTGQFKKGRHPKEAKQRSSDHFKKEIYPTLSKMDKLHFRRKYKGKI